VAEWRGNTPYNEKGQKIQLDTQAAVRMEEGMWPTPRTTGLDGGSNSRKAAKERGMWPTPSAQEPGWKHIEVVDKKGNPPTHPNQRFYHKETGRIVQKGLQQVVTMWPTPRVSMAHGPSDKEIKQGDPKRRLEVSVQLDQPGPKITGSLNPKWVAWLMGYPIEYLSYVPWETRSSRKSRKK